MTNVSVVEKISELMQQIEVNSPRVAALHYCLSEAARHIAELEQKLAESQREFRAADATIENMQMQVDKLAAENAGMKAAFGPGDAVMNFLTIALRHTTYDQIDLDDVTLAFKMSLPETPATDAFLAEVRAQARHEGINYAAGRLAAAFNHGFVDKTLAEVCDVVRMILGTKEELTSSMTPAVDGLSGEYAEKFLTEFAGYARKGVQS